MVKLRDFVLPAMCEMMNRNYNKPLSKQQIERERERLNEVIMLKSTQMEI